MQGMALGEIGLSLRDFYSLTYNEYHYVAKSYMFKDEREWIRMRKQTAFLINLQMAKDKNITEDMLFSLPSDKLIKKKKTTPTRAEFDAAVERYRKE